SGRFKWWKMLLVVAVCIALVVVSTLALVVDSFNKVQSSITSFQRVTNSLTNRLGTELTLVDFNRLDQSVKELASSLSSTRGRLRFLQPFASLNTTLDTTLTSIAAAEQLALAARN